MAVVGVPDERLERIAETLGSSEVVHETIDFHDIAGLVKGASQGEGLGNQFLASIRETDAICHVIRAHGAGLGRPPGGAGRPGGRRRADRDRAARRRPRISRAPPRAGHRSRPAPARRRRSPSATGSSGSSRRSRSGRPAREVPLPEMARDALRKLSPLTAKPVLYVVNVDEGVTEAPPDLVAHAERMRREGGGDLGPGGGGAARAGPRRGRGDAHTSSASSGPASSG